MPVPHGRNSPSAHLHHLVRACNIVHTNRVLGLMTLCQYKIPPVVAIAITSQRIKLVKLDGKDRLTLIGVDWELNVGCRTGRQ